MINRHTHTVKSISLFMVACFSLSTYLTLAGCALETRPAQHGVFIGSSIGIGDPYEPEDILMDCSARGYQGRKVTCVSDGVVWQSVVIGPFDTRNEAMAVMEELRDIAPRQGVDRVRNISVAAYHTELLE